MTTTGTQASAPQVTGTHGNQKSYTGQTLMPFSGVTITDDGRENQIYVGVNDDLSVGALLAGPSYSPLEQHSLGGNIVQYSFEGTPEQVSLELQGLIYTPTSSLRRNNLVLDVTDLTTKQSTFDQVTTIDNNTNTDTVSVDPAVVYSPNGAFEITGSATSPRLVGDLSLTGTSNGNPGLLASGFPEPDSTYRIYDPIGSEIQANLVVTETDLSGQQATTPVDFTLQGGIEGQRYVAIQTSFDPLDQLITGQAFFRADGAIVFQSSVSYNADGSTSTTYGDGTYFNNRPYYAFTDTSSADGTLLTEQRYRNDGLNAQIAEAPDQSLVSSSYDLLRGNEQGSTHFVFSSSYAEDVIFGFRLRGPEHDTVSLPSSDFSSIADVLRATQDTSQGSVITDPASGDTIRISGVSKDELIHHANVLNLR